MLNYFKVSLVFAVLVTVLACQNATSSSSDSGSDPVVSTSGTGTSVILGTSFTLVGTATTGATSYAWTFASVPSGSALTDASITDRTKATASFTPDLVGAYQVKLTATNGHGSTSATVTVTASLGQNIGTPVTLDATTTSAITYSWLLRDYPSGSSVVLAATENASTASGTPDLAGVYWVEAAIGFAGEITSTKDFAITILDTNQSVLPLSPSDSYQTVTLATGGTSLVYQVAVTPGSTYYLNWDDAYVGSGTYSLDAQVTVSTPAGVAIVDTNSFPLVLRDTGYVGTKAVSEVVSVAEPVADSVDYTRKIVVPAGVTSLLITVQGYGNGQETGTLGLRFSATAPTGFVGGGDDGAGYETGSGEGANILPSLSKGKAQRW